MDAVEDFEIKLVRELEGLAVGDREIRGVDDKREDTDEHGVTVCLVIDVTEGESESLKAVPVSDSNAVSVGFALCDADGDAEDDPICDFEIGEDFEAEGQTVEVEERTAVRVLVDERVALAVCVLEVVEVPERVKGTEAEGVLDLEVFGDTDKLDVALCVIETRAEAEDEPEADTLAHSETIAEALADGESEYDRDSFADRENELILVDDRLSKGD